MAKKVKKEKLTKDKVTREEKKEIKKAQKEDEEKVFALLSYLVLIIGVVFVLLTKKDRTDYSIYHAQQGLVLFFTLIFTILFAWILSFVPVLGWLMQVLVYMLWAALWIIGMLNALKMKKIPLPIIGEYGKNIKL